jgi:hypothetical protein
MSDIIHSRQRPEPQSARTRLDPGKISESIDIDEDLGLSDIELHQVQNRRSTGDELRFGGYRRHGAKSARTASSASEFVGR